MKNVAVLCAALSLWTAQSVADTANAQGTPAAATECSPAGDLQFVCGLVNVEDFLPVAGGRWLVAGSLKPGSVGLYLIDTTAKTAKPVALSVASKPDPLYGACPAPDLKGLATHGLDVAPGPGGTVTVYAINHGGRESVEIFRLTAAKASAEWVGCTVLPEGAAGNAVAHLPQGAFVVSKFVDTRDKQAIQTVMAGKINGAVYLWRPGRGFSEVPQTRFSGDNGLLASADGQWIYVNAYGTREIYRVPLSGHVPSSGAGAPSSVKVDFYPDNLRWAPDGTIFVTGQYLDPKNPGPGRHGWATVRLDPKTMTVTPFVKEPGYAQFDDATSGVQVGKTLWFGTFRGDRMAYRPAP